MSPRLRGGRGGGGVRLGSSDLRALRGAEELSDFRVHLMALGM